MSQTFTAFFNAVIAQVFPEGEAPNLKAVHKNWIKDGLIEIQQRVPCQQAKHADFMTQNSTFWNCGSTVFGAPRGFIKGLKTIAVDDICDEVRYMPTTKHEIECLIKEAEACACACASDMDEPYQYCGTYNDYGYLLGMRYANSTTDKDCRARSGVFTLEDDFIWMYPAIRSDEIAVLEWRGVKRAWNDSDLVEFDREVQRAVEVYLETETSRKEDCNIQAFTTARATYNDKIADLIWQCRKERRLPQPPPCFANCDAWYHCSGKPASSLSCATVGVRYFYGEPDPNGYQEGNSGDVYVQVTSSGAAFIWTKTTTGGNLGWI